MSAREEYGAHGSNVDALGDTLELAVPLRMMWMDRKARAWAAMTGRPADYARRVRELGREVWRPHWKWDDVGGGSEKLRRGTLTHSLIADTNAGVVAQMSDQLMGGSTPGAGETVFTALSSMLAAAALLQPDGATFHGHHWCVGACTACRGKP